VRLQQDDRSCWRTWPGLAYLAVSNAFTVLRLLPKGDREEDVEIFSSCHQITVLRRQLGAARSTFDPVAGATPGMRRSVTSALDLVLACRLRA
jgi:hypothetical protein